MYNYEIKNIRVIDGDTIEADIDLGFGVWLKKQIFRLYGINAPESRTRDKEEKAKGLKAKEWLKETLEEATFVQVRVTKGKGKYGRWLAEVYDEEGAPRMLSSLNDIMVDLGLAQQKDY